MRGLYSLAWVLAMPAVVVYLLLRSLRQPAYRRHWAQRFGLHPRRRSRAPLIWIHAVSVGETHAAQPLVRALAARHPDAEFLLTHMTPTGRDTGRALFGDAVRQAYLPYDCALAPGRFLRAWRPAVGILMETELWPNLMAAAQRERVPVAMVNARLSERSLRRGLRHRALVVPAGQRLSLVLAQSDDDARRLAELGRPADAVTGNLKFDISPPPELIGRGRAWRGLLGARHVVLAASTREGEEALLLQAWAAQVPASEPAPLLVVVPRHPQRFEEVAQMIERSGLAMVRRAALDAPGPDLQRCRVLLGDTMGEMVAWYAMADVAVIGGSLLPYGSQNLIEACAAGCPVLLGPHTFNFAEAAQRAIEAGAAVRVTDAHEAVARALTMVAAADTLDAGQRAAVEFAARHRGATARTLLALAPMLDAALGARRPN